MQVARLLEPKERTYKNKLIEIFRAFQLELNFSKDEILQQYLNLVPYGSNIEGVKSAAVIYFGKMPNHLSIAEITTLSIIPNRPVSLRLGLNNDSIIKERNKWLVRFRKSGLFQSEFIDDASDEGLTAYRREVPRFAPHLSYRLKSDYPEEEIIHSCIKLEIQRKTEQIVSEYSRRQYFQNIKNATAVIIDNKTRKVISYVGSADFHNDEDGGQVDGIQAIRSPGSTLKPLLYGIAIDRGLVTPGTIVADVPVSFGGYEPENYDEKFHGPVTIEFALANSLNVPAVRIANELSPSAIIEKLIDAGFTGIKKQKDELGLSLILGGCGVTLEELSGLFCSFANKGIYRRLAFTENPFNKGNGIEIISENAAFIITEILTQLKRPDLPIYWSDSKNTPRIAWKTGTSYGRKDAWSIGYNNEYTIGVWVGNFSGEGVPELSGSEKATPLLFQLFNAIDISSENDWFKMPESLDLRYVCSGSGRLPGEFCEDLVIDYFIPGVSDTRACDHLKKILLSPDSSISYCTACMPETGYVSAIYPNYSPEIITYFEESSIPYRKIPPHNPDCEQLLTGSCPQITSPVHENDYYVNVKDSMQIMLSCHASNDVQRVHWYINKKHFASAGAEEKIFFRPNQGKVEISCSDDKGRNSEIVIYVSYTSF